MLRTIEKTLTERCRIEPGAALLLGVSGGADSVAMTYALRHLAAKRNWLLSVAHLNHGIRGRAADEDEQFVRELAWRLGLLCLTEKVDVPRLAAQGGLSLEMAAREARYAFFQKAAATLGVGYLATAHTADDQAETVLLRLARGAGSRGLGGILYRSEHHGLDIVRPLRDVTHTAARMFLQRHGLVWREDGSNTKLDFLRNRVRHEILPVLETRLNPRIREALLRAGEVLGEENAWMEMSARRIYRKAVRAGEPGVLRIPVWAREPVAARRRVIRLWLMENGLAPELVDYAMVHRILELASVSKGTQTLPLGDGWSVTRRYHELVFHKGSQPILLPFMEALTVPGETLLMDAGLRVLTRWRTGEPLRPHVHVGSLPSEVTLSGPAIGHSPVVVRSWQPGDRIRPLGFSGSKKIQDLFVDAKVPRDRRGEIPVLVCRGEVIWAAGYRVARGWEVQRAEDPSLHVFIERIASPLHYA